MELPEVVVHEEILMRLPLKSVARFKCVSQSWLSLFSSSQFIKDLCTHSTTPNLVAYDSLVAKNADGIYLFSRYNQTYLPDVCFEYHELIGSINGLLCLRHRCSVNILLWNPTIHQAKEVTSPANGYSDLSHIGFGFDAVSNDYKVVVCCLCDGRTYAYVYSFNSGSWIDLFVPDDMFPSHKVHALVGPSTIVKDCPCWKIYKYSSDKRFKYVFVVRFDVRRNEFKSLPGFRYDANSNDFRPKRCRFVNMKDNLTMMVHQQNSSNLMVDVYSLDEEEGSWIQRTTYNIRISEPGAIDFGVRRLTQCFEYGGETLFHKHHKFFCYDQKTDTIKHIVYKRPYLGSVRCYSYRPSLVFLEGMKSVITSPSLKFNF